MGQHNTVAFLNCVFLYSSTVSDSERTAYRYLHCLEASLCFTMLKLSKGLVVRGIATIKANEAVALVKVWKMYSNEGNLVL